MEDFSSTEERNNRDEYYSSQYKLYKEKKRIITEDQNEIKTSEYSILVDGIDINKKADVQYVELVFVQKSLSFFKLKCYVDYGQKFRFGKPTLVELYDGRVINFNSTIEGLNYFISNGWEFVDAYPISYGKTSVYHFLLRRVN